MSYLTKQSWRSNPEAHYGLFRSDGSAKPSAQELQTLLAHLDSLKKTQRSSAPFTLAIRGAHSLLLTITSGAAVLIVWPDTDLQTGPEAAADIAGSRVLIVQELSLATGGLSAIGLSAGGIQSLNQLPSFTYCGSCNVVVSVPCAGADSFSPLTP